jgi:hypothetical protein
MEATASETNFSFSVWAAIAIVLAILITYLVFVFMPNADTMPKFTEGFAAPVVGAGVPDCLRDSSEAAQIVGIFQDRVGSVEEGPADLRELTVLLSKLACMKRDLVAVASVVNATLYQPFVTAHDVEPVAETVGRCFSKTIPRRDLELSFEKWKTRGRFLIQRLCGAAAMSRAEVGKVGQLFDAVLVDTYDIAQQKCLQETPVMEGSSASRSADGYSPPEIKDLGEYKGYY